MTTFLVLYGTGEGQTAAVADRIAETLDARGHGATAIDADAAPGDLDVEDYDAVFVGASIHVGKHQPAFVEGRLGVTPSGSDHR